VMFVVSVGGVVVLGAEESSVQGERAPGERHSLNRIILNSAVNSVRSWKVEGEEKGRG
jgi:hypothetical protein